MLLIRLFLFSCISYWPSSAAYFYIFTILACIPLLEEGNSTFVDVRPAAPTNMLNLTHRIPFPQMTRNFGAPPRFFRDRIHVC